jgi:hypothetical protein
MGSIHLYLSKFKFPQDWSAVELKDKILKQRSAYLLDKIVEKFPKDHRDSFPTITSLEFNSGNYSNEKAYLNSGQVKLLKQEFDTLLDILLKKQFISKVDSATIIELLCNDQHPKLTKVEILNELYELKDLIDYANKEKCNIYIDR